MLLPNKNLIPPEWYVNIRTSHSQFSNLLRSHAVNTYKNANPYSIVGITCINNIVEYYSDEALFVSRAQVYGEDRLVRITSLQACVALGLIQVEEEPEPIEEQPEEQLKPPSAEINVNNNISLEHAACIIAAGCMPEERDVIETASKAISIAQEIFKQCKSIKDAETTSGKDN